MAALLAFIVCMGVIDILKALGAPVGWWRWMALMFFVALAASVVSDIARWSEAAVTVASLGEFQ